MRFLTLSILLGGCHCLISMAIVPLTLWVGNSFPATPVKNQLLFFLHFGTKVFYFPIVSLALYPRHWFPGPWIYVPVIVNSLLWGFLIGSIIVVFRPNRLKRAK